MLFFDAIQKRNDPSKTHTLRGLLSQTVEAIIPKPKPNHEPCATWQSQRIYTWSKLSTCKLQKGNTECINIWLSDIKIKFTNISWFTYFSFLSIDVWVMMSNMQHDATVAKFVKRAHGNYWNKQISIGHRKNETVKFFYAENIACESR